ncbi:2-amino-4-hydroxy-6-hydroxymethyldihydropteridine diphosphokinase [Alloiococcus otitis]|uniref:2-amino-4-hydroxy-6- hydroxymethyldihydropteridine diphosphokinase n=1 Tax=Alloiococcus otitis TaxID=1652 RepID=UPI0023532070|nr:2-amino-4-hydroxy-6-hydroxymethyldihydropteridine diphosphokinase [Alloiococcus otitis]
MKDVMIGLGSNIGAKSDYLNQALVKINGLDQVAVKQVSQVYQTEPVGYKDQDDFYNMVAALEIEEGKAPLKLLEDLLAIEADLDRKRTIKNGPRTIDLDVLLVEDQEIDDPKLQVPHPRLQDRAFVLVPLAELAPNYLVPGLNKTVSDLLDELDQADLTGVKALGQLTDLANDSEG